MKLKLRMRGLPVIGNAMARRNRLIKNLNTPIDMNRVKGLVDQLITKIDDLDPPLITSSSNFISNLSESK